MKTDQEHTQNADQKQFFSKIKCEFGHWKLFKNKSFPEMILKKDDLFNLPEDKSRELIELAELKSKVKQVRLEEKLDEQDTPYESEKLLIPITWKREE